MTLDTNCVIALDEGREPEASCLRSLLVKHDQGRVYLQLIATSASERQASGPYLDNFGKFLDRLSSLGLSHLPLLIPLMVLDLSYLDYCILASDEDIDLLVKLHSKLFSNQPYSLQDTLAAAGPGVDSAATEHKWRNRHLDVHAMWCHLHYKGDIFVTSDRNFIRKQRALTEFGAPVILDPCSADARV